MHTASQGSTPAHGVCATVERGSGQAPSRCPGRCLSPGGIVQPHCRSVVWFVSKLPENHLRSNIGERVAALLVSLSMFSEA